MQSSYNGCMCTPSFYELNSLIYVYYFNFRDSNLKQLAALEITDVSNVETLVVPGLSVVIFFELFSISAVEPHKGGETVQVIH